MILFLLASLPILFAFVILLPWGSTHVPGTLTLISTFLKGMLIFFPGYLLILLGRRIFGFSYEGFRLYLSLLLRDHLVPVLVALAGFLLLQRKLGISRAEEGIFLSVLAFMAGFFSLLNITDMLRAWGSWDAYALFMLPVLRIALVLLVSLTAQRFFRWEGRDGAFYCVACTALALVPALASFLFWINRLGLSVVFAALAFLSAAVVFARRFPRPLRG